MTKETTRQIQNTIFILFIILIFLVIYIVPLPFTEKEVSKNTLNEINKQCSSIGGLLVLADEKSQQLCSKYSKIYYLFIFGFIVSVIFLLINIFQHNKKEEQE